MKPEAADYLRAGLSAMGLRHRVLANNIANLNTPGFRRGQVQFEPLLAEAIKSGKAPDEVQPLLGCSSRDASDPSANDVDLDTEVGELVRTSTMYKAYFRLLGKLMRQMDLAIHTEGT